MTKCRECGIGKLKIMGTGGFGDMVEVKCQNPECGEMYDVEPDVEPDAWFEWVEAMMME